MTSKGKPKPNIRELSREWPSRDEARKLADFVHSSQPSLIVAILAVAMLEFDLERLLRKKFKNSDDKSWARLTSENGPLATFAQKITAAHGFGIIDDHKRISLNCIKNIRNVFAHSKKLVEFDDAIIVEELKKVRWKNKKNNKVYREMITLKPIHPKIAFTYLCLSLSVYLIKKLTQASNVSNSKMRKRLDWGILNYNPLTKAFQEAGGLSLSDIPPSLGQGGLATPGTGFFGSAFRSKNDK